MPAIKLTEQELDALTGLPHLAFRLYVAGIRPRMDYRNGTVGIAVRVSWLALAQDCYVEPKQGFKGDHVSQQQARRAMDWLKDAGLIVMDADNEAKRQLVFSCPLAETDKSVRKKADRSPTEQADRPKAPKKPAVSRVYNGPALKADRAEKPKADRHPESGDSLYKNLPPNDQPYVTGGGEETEGQGKTETAPALIFPAGLKDAERAAIGRNLSGMGPYEGQAVLDALAGSMQAGEAAAKSGKHDLRVRFPVKLASSFMDAIRAGRIDEVQARGSAILGARINAAAVEREQEEKQRALTEAAIRAGAPVGKPKSLAALVKKGRAGGA